MALNLEEDNVGAAIFADPETFGRVAKFDGPGALPRCRSAMRCSDASSTRSARPIDGLGRHQVGSTAPYRTESPWHRPAPVRSKSRCRPASRRSTR